MLEIAQESVEHVSFNEKDAGNDVRGISHAYGLIVPDDVADVEGDLLFGFELDDLGDFFGFDGGQGDESCLAVSAGYADDYGGAFKIVGGKEFGDGLANDLIVAGGGQRGQRLGIIDNGEIGDLQALGGLFELHGPEAILPDVDTPSGFAFTGHIAGPRRGKAR